MEVVPIPRPYMPVDKLQLSVRDHGNPVRFRTIWIRKLGRSGPIPSSPISDVDSQVASQ